MNGINREEARRHFDLILKNLNTLEGKKYFYVKALEDEDLISLKTLLEEDRIDDKEAIYYIYRNYSLTPKNLLFMLKNKYTLTYYNLIEFIIQKKDDLIYVLRKYFWKDEKEFILMILTNYNNKRALSRQEFDSLMKKRYQHTSNFINVNDDKSLDKSPLILAIRYNNVKIVKYLLDLGVDVNEKFTPKKNDGLSKYQKTPLIVACENRVNFEIAECLIDHGANVNEETRGIDVETGTTPLISAIRFCNEPLIRYMVEHGADVNKMVKENTINGLCWRSPLYYAFERGNEFIIRYLVEQGAEDKDLLNQNQIFINNPLITACKKQKESLIKYLVELGFNINCTSYKYTPLIAACENNDMKIIKYLIENGADVNLRSKEYTPLTMACKINNSELVDYLIQQGAYINLKDIENSNNNNNNKNKKSQNKGYDDYIEESFNMMFNLMNGYNNLLHIPKTLPFPSYDSPLMMACRKKNKYLVKCLIEHGADVNEVCIDNSTTQYTTALSIACYDQDIELVKYLLEHGADPNLKRITSPILAFDSPLVMVCQKPNDPLMKLLVEHGADVNRGGKNNTPLLAVMDYWKEDEVLPRMQYLVEHGADVNQPWGRFTPLIMACKKYYFNCVKYLVEHGANVNAAIKAKDFVPSSPLITSLNYINLDIMEYLLENGADINGVIIYKNSKTGEETVNDTLLILSLDKNLLDPLPLVQFLVEHGADVNQKGYYHTPLSKACDRGYFGVVKYLVEQGANVNQKVLNPNINIEVTPLSISKKKGYSDIEKYLIEHGAIHFKRGVTRFGKTRF